MLAQNAPPESVNAGVSPHMGTQYVVKYMSSAQIPAYFIADISEL